MNFDNESAEFYSNKRMDFKIPRQENKAAATYPSGKMPIPKLDTTLFPSYSQYYPSPDAPPAEANTQQPTGQTQPQVPAQPLPPGTSVYPSGYEYVSPMAAADQDYTKQQMHYQQQPSNTYLYPKRYSHKSAQGKRTPPVQLQPGAQVFKPEFYIETETTTLKRKATDANPPKSDANLPPEIRKLMQALFCALCNAQLNSSISAKTHYDSKVHERKVRNWLEVWSAETGNPMPERPSMENDSPVGPNAFHCQVCDVALTSQSHAQQHYLGKKHQQVIAGKGKPKGSGYYDKEGVWHKTIFPKSNDSRFGIGHTFVPATIPIDDTDTVSSTNQEETAAMSVLVAMTPLKKSKGNTPEITFYCKLCDIFATSQQLLELHFNGAKHKKKLKLQTVITTPDGTEVDSQFSANRTPSGLFYCPCCDLTLTSDSQLKQHFESKKHNKMLQEKKKAEKR